MCLDGDSAQVVLLSEVELEPGVKVECVSKFCYLGDTLGSGGGVVEADLHYNNAHNLQSKSLQS